MIYGTGKRKIGQRKTTSEQWTAWRTSGIPSTNGGTNGLKIFWRKNGKLKKPFNGFSTFWMLYKTPYIGCFRPSPKRGSTLTFVSKIPHHSKSAVVTVHNFHYLPTFCNKNTDWMHFRHRIERKFYLKIYLSTVCWKKRFIIEFRAMQIRFRILEGTMKNRWCFEKQ